MHMSTEEQSRSISIHNIEIDWKERGLRPSGHKVHWLGGLGGMLIAE